MSLRYEPASEPLHISVIPNTYNLGPTPQDHYTEGALALVGHAPALPPHPRV